MMLSYEHAAFAKENNPCYSDFRDRPAALTEAEQSYFRQTVEKVLSILGIEIPVYMCDQERFPGSRGDALGIHWKNAEGDEFITIDNYFIHEAYEVAFHGAYDLNGETLETVLCHELAHIRYQRHNKYHAELTEQYIDTVEKAKVDEWISDFCKRKEL